MSNWLELAGLGTVVFSAILMLALAYLRRKSHPVFRDIPAFTHLRQAVGLVVEDGSRLHVSLGQRLADHPSISFRPGGSRSLAPAGSPDFSG